ncbi:MAG: hypothetical protein ACYDA9_18245, partial [Terriglobia bacterium]
MIVFLMLLGLLGLSTPSAKAGVGKTPSRDTRATSSARALAQYARLPMSFERNQGQTDHRVKFLARGDGYGLFL